MAELYKPETKLSIISDEPDNRLLELANTSKADFIITGNTTDFTMESYKKNSNFNAKRLLIKS
jgi:predicted nucleic acid-binding protein